MSIKAKILSIAARTRQARRNPPRIISRKMTHLLRCAALFACVLFAGCACGRVGTLATRQTLTPTAEVVEVYGFGALLRPTPHDGGLSLGYRRATYIYPRLAGDTRPVGETMHWGWAPLRDELPFFLGTQETGLEFQTVAGRTMLHAGYVDQSFSFVARADESRRGSFFYLRPHPERTVLALLTEPEPALALTTHP